MSEFTSCEDCIEYKKSDCHSNTYYCIYRECCHNPNKRNYFKPKPKKKEL